MKTMLGGAALAVMLGLAGSAQAENAGVPVRVTHVSPLAGGHTHLDSSDTIYDNGDLNNQLFTLSLGAPDFNSLDDLTLAPGAQTIDGFTLGIAQTASSARNLFGRVTFYDTVLRNDTNIARNPLGSVSFNFNNVGPGAGLFQVGLATPIALTDNQIGIQEEFFTTAAQTAYSTRFRPLYDGGPNLVGSSDDISWDDFDNNGLFYDNPADRVNDESLIFNDPANGVTGFNSNFFVQLTGTLAPPVPEPGSVALLGAGLLGGLGLLARRRRG